MIKKAILFFAILLLFLGSVSATRYIRFSAYESVLAPHGVIESTDPMRDFFAIGYVCSNDECNPPKKQLWNGDHQTSTDGENRIVLPFPGDLKGTETYGAVFYKPGYFTWEQSGMIYVNGRGTDTAQNPKDNPNKVYFAKAAMCKSQVDTFSVINSAKPYVPLIINVTSNLSVNAKSALNHNGPITYVPSELRDDYYSIETEIVLEIFDESGNIVKSETRLLNIELSDLARSSFTWIPTEPGNYSARVTSFVTDEKCLASEEMYAENHLRVYEEEPDEQCYTNLIDLNATDFIDIMEGDLVEIRFGKVSNKADDGIYSPLPTSVELTILDKEGNIAYHQSDNLPANANYYDYEFFSYDWTADITGNATIIVDAIALNCPYDDNQPYRQVIAYDVIKQPECYSDTDCGIDRFIGDLFCKDQDVFGTFREHECVNPGTSLSFCDSKDEEMEYEACAFGCRNGECISEDDIACFDDSDCDDSNHLTIDACVNPGEIDSYCENQAIECASESDCGTDGFTGSPFCFADDLYDTYKDYSCQNAGRLDSSCMVEDTSVLKEECAFGCRNGECISEDDIACFDDSDCPIDGFMGSEYCFDDNVYDVYASYECRNSGGPDSYCEETGTDMLKEECTYGCENGICAGPGDVTCFSDSDCGTSYYITPPYCDDDSVYRKYRFFTCENEGLASSYCDSFVSRTMIEDCEFKCEDGSCLSRRDHYTSEDLQISSIDLGIIDRYIVDEQIHFSISLKNDARAPIEDLGIGIVIYDLGLYYKFGDIDLDPGEEVTRSRAFMLPSFVERGRYDARIVVSNDEIRRVIHREVIIR